MVSYYITYSISIKKYVTMQIKKILCPSLTVPNVLQKVDKYKKFEIPPIPVGERTNQTFFIWARFFLDNSKTTIRHVWSQVDKVRVIFANERKSACKVNSNFLLMI